MPGSGLKVYGGSGGGVRTKFSVQLWSQAEQKQFWSKKEIGPKHFLTKIILTIRVIVIRDYLNSHPKSYPC